MFTCACAHNSQTAGWVVIYHLAHSLFLGLNTSSQNLSLANVSNLCQTPESFWFYFSFWMSDLIQERLLWISQNKIIAIVTSVIQSFILYGAWKLMTLSWLLHLLQRWWPICSECERTCHLVEWTFTVSLCLFFLVLILYSSSCSIQVFCNVHLSGVHGVSAWFVMSDRDRSSCCSQWLILLSQSSTYPLTAFGFHCNLLFCLICFLQQIWK